MSLSKIGIQFFFALDYSKYMCCCTTDFGRHHFSFLYNFEKCVILSLRYCCYYFWKEKKNTIRKYKYLQIDYYSSTYIWLDFPISLSYGPTYTLYYLVWYMKSKIVSYQCCLKWKINLIKCFLSSLSLHCTRHKNKTIIIGTITHITLKQNLKFCMAQPLCAKSCISEYWT